MLALDLTTIIFEILNFIVLTALLYRFLFRPVMRNVQARAADKERLLHELYQERQDAAQLRAKLQEQLNRIEEEAAQRIDQARAEAATERAKIVTQAHTEADRILKEAHQDAQLWRQQAVSEFHDDLLQTILAISRETIGVTAPPELHDMLVNQLNDRIWQLGRHEIQRVEAVRRSLGDRIPTAYVNTARLLSPEQQSLLTRTFSALADRSVNLEQTLDPTLAVGLRVRLGDIMIDHSLKGQLNELRDRVSQALIEQI